MREVELVRFLTTPTVSRGAITIPNNIRTKLLKASDAEVKSWKEIGSSKTPERILNQGEAAALLAKEILRNKDDLNFLNDINQEVLNRALMIAYCLSEVGPDGRHSNTILSKRMMHIYRGILADTLFHNDFIPVFNDGSEEKKYEIDYIHNTIKHVFRESFWFSGKGFERLAYPMKSDGLEWDLKQLPLFERFLEKTSLSYKKHWDTEHDRFPGPGMIVSGFTKMFPDGALKTQLWSHPDDNLEAHQAVKRDFRNQIVSSEDLLSEAKVGFFRGLTFVSHPTMIVSGKPFSLVIYNEHFQGDYIDEGEEALKLSYLVPNKFIKEFEYNPFNRNLLTPNWIDRSKVRKQILDLTCPSVVAGLQRAISSAPNKNEFYPNSNFRNYSGEWYRNDLFGHERSLLLEDETRDANGHMHVTHMDEEYKHEHPHGYWSNGFPLENLKPFKDAHDEIAKATNIGFAILRTVLRGFNNYCYGYDYMPENPKFKLTESTRMLDQSVRWYLSARKNKPMLVPCTEYGFDRGLVEEIGVVDTNTNYCLKRKGSFELPGEPFSDLPDPSKASYKKAWLDGFLGPCFHNNAFLVQMPSDQAGSLIKEILGARK